MTRILHITRDYPPASKGGLSTAVAGLVQVAEQVGYQVAVVSFDDWRPSRATRSEVDPSNPSSATSSTPILRVTGPRDIDQAHAFAAQFRPDLVHCHSGMLAEFTRQIDVSAPWLFHVHVAQDLVHRWRGLSEPNKSLLGYQQALHDADHVVFPSQDVHDAVVSNIPGLRVRSRVLPFGIFDTLLAQESARKREGKSVLYVGRFADVKGTAELIEVFKHLRGRYPDLPLEIVGGSPASPKQTRRWVRKFKDALGDDGFSYLGWGSEQEVSEALGRARVLVIPSHVETFGLVALEGMLHGVPIVASDCMGLRERFQDTLTASLVPAGDVEAFVEAIVGLIEDESLGLSMGERAAAEVRDGFLWSQVAPAWIEAYSEMALAQDASVRTGL